MKKFERLTKETILKNPFLEGVINSIKEKTIESFHETIIENIINNLNFVIDNNISGDYEVHVIPLVVRISICQIEVEPKKLYTLYKDNYNKVLEGLKSIGIKSTDYEAETIKVLSDGYVCGVLDITFDED